MLVENSRRLVILMGAPKSVAFPVLAYLRARKPALAEQDWVMSVRPGKPSNWAHMFERQQDSGGARLSLVHEVFADMLAHIDHGFRDVVIGAEDLFLLPSDDIRTIAKALSERFFTISIICYLRRQDQMALEHWAIGARNPVAAHFFGGLQPQAMAVTPDLRMALDYEARLKAWTSALPAARLVLRVIGRDLPEDADFAADFLGQAEIRLGAQPAAATDAEPEAQGVPGATTARLSYLLRGAGISAKEIIRMHNAQLIPRSDDRALPARDAAAAFVAEFADSNARLAALLGVEEVFSTDFASYPDAGDDSGLDPALVQDTLLALLVDALRPQKPGGGGKAGA